MTAEKQLPDRSSRPRQSAILGEFARSLARLSLSRHHDFARSDELFLRVGMRSLYRAFPKCACFGRSDLPCPREGPEHRIRLLSEADSRHRNTSEGRFEWCHVGFLPDHVKQKHHAFKHSNCMCVAGVTHRRKSALFLIRHFLMYLWIYVCREIVG